MFKLIVLVFAALFALAAARPSYLAASPVVYSTHYVQPVVRTHYSVPVVKTVVSPVVHTSVVKTVLTPVVHTPVVHSVVTPVVHAAPVVHASPLYHSVNVVKSYAPAYGAWKN